MTTDELVRLLGSGEMQERGKALIWAHQNGIDGARGLVAAMRDPRANVTAQAWAMIGLEMLRPLPTDVTHDVLVEKLSDPSPTTRCHAIRTLEKFDDVTALAAIARLVNDHTVDGSAWGEEDCSTVAGTAAAAVNALTASAEKSGRLTVHVFISTGRFQSFDEMRAYVDKTYTEDGEGVPSPFMREVELHGYEPMRIEAIESESRQPVSVAELVAKSSWADRWLPALDGARTADAAICVFSPNLVVYPERCALAHLGCVHFRVNKDEP
ncbi:MAG TPA: immunity 22 family protein [Polyangia bacterium]|jgi:hypothetical protein|nr:immunity 22 family protein [Polyangia bacterium]